MCGLDDKKKTQIEYGNWIYKDLMVENQIHKIKSDQRSKSSPQTINDSDKSCGRRFAGVKIQKLKRCAQNLQPTCAKTIAGTYLLKDEVFRKVDVLQPTSHKLWKGVLRKLYCRIEPTEVELQRRIFNTTICLSGKV